MCNMNVKYMYASLIFIRLQSLNLAVMVISDLGHLDVPQMCHTFGQAGIVVKQIPFAIDLAYGMV